MAVLIVTTVIVTVVDNFTITITIEMDPLLVNSNCRSDTVVFRDQR